MVYAYVRVSTETQSGSSQRFEIENWAKRQNMIIDRWVEESVSGTIPVQKRLLGRTIRKMRKGDSLVCTEISRLGRNMLMIMSVLNDCSSKCINIHTIKDGFDLSSSINSKIIAFAFALAAEIERNLISQRTKEALADKKAAGVILGRPIGSSVKKTEFIRRKEEVDALLEKGVPKTKIARKLGISRNTLNRYLFAYKYGKILNC